MTFLSQPAGGGPKLPLEDPAEIMMCVMRATDPTPSLFVDAVEIPAYLDADRNVPYTQRLRRDRAIGASLCERDPLRQVRAWRRMQSPPSGESGSAAARALAERLDRARRIIGLSMALLGALAGIGVASAVFRYDGTWPVNVVTVLAVLALLQSALAVLTVLLMLPRVAGLRAVQELLGNLNPGALVAAIYRRIARLDERHADLLVWPAARGPALGRFARWQMLVWSQIAAIAFNLAALATAAGLIAFTDLAFGWSTTLRLDGQTALRLTDALATPWAWVWPDAVPSASLIEHSRFFRLASAPPPKISAEVLAGWWPFLLAAMITYGLVPRCALCAIALLRLRRATVHLLLDDPQVKALLDRMSTAQVALGAEDIEAPAPPSSTVAQSAPAGALSQAVGIVWSSAFSQDDLKTWSRRHLQKDVTQTFQAGGGRDLQHDTDLIGRLAESRPASVLVFVRAWESPLLDLQDFLENLRNALGPTSSIVIVPVGPGGAVADAPQRATWARWVGRIADPALYVESGT